MFCGEEKGGAVCWMFWSLLTSYKQHRFDVSDNKPFLFGYWSSMKSSFPPDDDGGKRHHEMNTSLGIQADIRAEYCASDFS